MNKGTENIIEIITKYYKDLCDVSCSALFISSRNLFISSFDSFKQSYQTQAYFMMLLET